MIRIVFVSHVPLKIIALRSRLAIAVCKDCRFFVLSLLCHKSPQTKSVRLAHLPTVIASQKCGASHVFLEFSDLVERVIAIADVRKKV